MSAQRWVLQFASVLLLVTGACAQNEPPTLSATDRGRSVYPVLARGGDLYAGTIQEVSPTSGRRHLDSGEVRIEEQGDLKFLVTQTIFGEKISELHTSYMCTRPATQLLSDFGGHVWDDSPPKSGMHLALLVYGKKDRERFAGMVKTEGCVAAIWPTSKDDPFINEIGEACGFVTATESKDRIRLVKRLARSEFKTIRLFVQDGVFGVDDHDTPQPPDAPPEVVLEYLRASSVAVTDGFDRAVITQKLTAWLHDEKHATAIPEDLRASVEDWYVAELDALGNDPYRDVATLGGLRILSAEMGARGMLALFKHTGRAGLRERVKTGMLNAKQQAQDEGDKLLDILAEK